MTNEDQKADPSKPEEKSSGFGTRLISALVMVPMAIAVVYYGDWVLVGFVTFAVAVMSFEWNRLTRQEGQKKSFYGLIVTHSVTVAVASFFAMKAAWGLAFAALGVGGLVILVMMIPKRRSPLWPLLAIPYFGLPGMGLLWLRASASMTEELAGTNSGLAVVVWLFFVVWASDGGGYIFGKSIGGPKLAPRISPKKTWSGFLGGAFLAGIMGLIAASVLDWEIARDIIILSLILSVISQVGDLVESAIKRHFDVKDIGSFIPGHGGVMDRMDGLLFAMAAAALLGIAQGGVLIK
ncbi:MAG: phosphatidate cytidylyltransferase [Alphaproteobacteria bacterium]|nr:MAG: phosphatidate cytidylyltransferase [Alphaproteobacteria bacterium]